MTEKISYSAHFPIFSVAKKKLLKIKSTIIKQVTYLWDIRQVKGEQNKSN